MLRRAILPHNNGAPDVDDLTSGIDRQLELRFGRQWSSGLWENEPSPRDQSVSISTDDLTRGRAAGRDWSVAWVSMRHGDELIVVGSCWARTRHPGWSANLLANPHCSVAVGRTTQHACAGVLSAQEAEELWPSLEALCPVWRTYRERSGRDLHIFALQRSGRDLHIFALRREPTEGVLPSE